MSRAEVHKKIHYLLLIGIAISMPFPLKLSSLLIILCALNWLIEGNLYNKIKNTFNDRINLIHLTFWNGYGYSEIIFNKLYFALIGEQLRRRNLFAKLRYRKSFVVPVQYVQPYLIVFLSCNAPFACR